MQVVHGTFGKQQCNGQQNQQDAPHQLDALIGLLIILEGVVAVAGCRQCDRVEGRCIESNHRNQNSHHNDRGARHSLDHIHDHTVHIAAVQTMETVKMSFGQKGSILFAVLNVLQLVGWTAIMIYDGALAADGVMHTGRWIWCLVIGVLIILWIVIGITNLGKINTVAMAALFLLSLILSKVIFAGGGAGAPSDDSMTFGAAVELAVAMPLSWLPLISDYTREAKEPVKATAISAVVYGIVSCWMYVIGMGAAIITGEYDIAQIMLKVGLGIAGLLIIVFSTVTTTFLDAYSAGISSETVVSKWNGKHVAIVVTVIGTIAAIVYPMDNITDFLYLIGSVFAPMIAIQIADFFLLKRDKSSLAVHIPNLIIWVIGFVVYRILMNIDMPLGNTLPDMVITIVICLIVGKFVS